MKKSHSLRHTSVSGSDAISGRDVKITDLCAEDRERIANLLRALAKTVEEKESTAKQLAQERALFEEQKGIMVTHLKQLVKEKRAIKKSMDDCQALINELHHVLYVQKNQDQLSNQDKKSFSTTSVQTEDSQSEDSVTNYWPVFQRTSVRGRYLPDIGRIVGLSSELHRELTTDQRHEMEVTLKRQEQLLREKQALLQLKQNEFKKRFDYFAAHGKFPDSTALDSSPITSNSSESKVSSEVAAPVPVITQKTPVTTLEKRSPKRTPQNKISKASSPTKQCSTAKQEEKTKGRTPHTTPSTRKKQSSSHSTQDASVGVNLDRSIGSDSSYFVKQRSGDFGYAQERELSDCANISALLASVIDDDEVADDFNSASFSNEPMKKSPNKRFTTKVLNNTGSSMNDLLNTEETTLLEEVFFLT